MKNWLLLVLCSSAMAACGDPQPASTPEVPVKSSATAFEASEEPHRPVFHFTPDSMWMNDPNGMFFLDGTYHLYYQFHPHSNVWGPMHWGHATSEDLMHWAHHPIALAPDTLGLIFSGSCVVDTANTSGLGEAGRPAVLAYFTHHSMELEASGSDQYQVQSMAYSLDGGMTFTKYAGNPIIPNPGIRDFRDPKVVWHEASGKWVMVFAAFDRVRFYESSNGIEWSFASEFGAEHGSHGGVWECPELLTIDGQDVLIVSLNNGGPNGGSCTQYFLGNYADGAFVNANPAEEVLWLDHGKDNYAGVTWNHTPGVNRFMGWMSNWQYATVVPTENWRSAMTTPRDLRICENASGEKRICSSLPAEVVEAFGAPVSLPYRTNAGGVVGHLKLLPQPGTEVLLTNAAGDSLRLVWDEKSFALHRTAASGKTDFHPEFAGVHTAPWSGGEAICLFDRSSVEVFADAGASVLTEIFFANEDFDQIEVNHPATFRPL